MVLWGIKLAMFIRNTNSISLLEYECVHYQYYHIISCYIYNIRIHFAGKLLCGQVY